MTVPVLLLTTVLSAAQQSAPPTSPVPFPSTIRFDAQKVAPPEQRDRATNERPHEIGIGAQMSMSSSGAGGGFRYFMNDRLGFNFTTGVQRGRTYSTTSGTQRPTTFFAMPSVIFMLTKPDSTRDIDLRPYVGGGLTYVQTSQPVSAGNGAVRLQGVSGVGGQTYFGVEITFREASFITISAEGMYYKLPVDYVNAAVVDGFNYNLAFHFYLK